MHPSNPPKWPLRILEWICSDRQLEVLYGDVLEVFERRVEEIGHRKARLLFFRDVFSLTRPFAMKKYRPQHAFQATLSLYRNYLKLAVRSSARNKLSFIINFIGLAVGFYAALLIGQHALFELSFDRFHPDAEETYRVSLQRMEQNRLTFNGATTFLPVGPMLQEMYPEVYNQCRFYYPFTHAVIKYAEEAYHEEKPVFADETFFDVFGFVLLSGDRAMALAEPNTVVLSQRLAAKYFGSATPMGQTIRFSFEDGEADLKVTGIIEDPRMDSHLALEMLISMKTLDQWPIFRDNEWALPFYHTYIQLQPGTPAKAFEEKASGILAQFRPPDNTANSAENFVLQPLTDIHLHSNLTFELGENGDRQAIDFLILIAGLILIIVYLNYINLSTALSSLRGREVGIRKVMGSYRGQIIPRFLIEAIVINMVALMLAFGGALLTQDYFATRFDIHFLLPQQASFWLGIVGFVLLGAVMSSVYPALITASYMPSAILRGKVSLRGSGGALRKVLIATQFAISAAMIGGMLLIAQQTNYLLNKDLGFDSEQLLVVSAPRSTPATMMNDMQRFGAEVTKDVAVHAFSASNSVPGRVMSSGSVRRADQQGQERTPVHLISVDEGYFETYSLSFQGGRPFSRSIPTDAEKIIVNLAALEALGYATVEEAVGSRLSAGGNRAFEILGVVNDYHHSSLKTHYEPIVFLLNLTSPVYMSLRMGTEQVPETLAAIKALMQSHFPQSPFEYFFLDQVFDHEFKAELRYGDLLKGFALLAIVLASLGLFGLASFLIIQCTKEMGIRRVLGASSLDFFRLLSSHFFMPLAVGSFTALVTLYYVGHGWLNTFPFRIDMHWLVFVVPLVLIITMTGITLSVLTWKTLRMELVTILKRE